MTDLMQGPPPIRYRKDFPNEKYWIDIYNPVSGWKAIMYGPEGPEETGMFAFRTPEEAYRDALSWAQSEDIPLQEREF